MILARDVHRDFSHEHRREDRCGDRSFLRDTGFILKIEPAILKHSLGILKIGALFIPRLYVPLALLVSKRAKNEVSQIMTKRWFMTLVVIPPAYSKS